MAAASAALAIVTACVAPRTWAKRPTGSTFSWISQTGGSWTDAANWKLVSGPRGDGYPNGARDAAEFTTTGKEAQTVTIPDGAQVTVGSIDFGSSQPFVLAAGDSTAGLTIAGAAKVGADVTDDAIDVPVTLDAPLTTSVANGASLTFGASINQSTPSGVTKTGAGVLDLAAANTFSGGVAMNAGTIAVGDDGALGVAPGVLALQPKTAVRGVNGPHVLAVPVELSGDGGRAITFEGTDLTFNDAESIVTMPTRLDVENHTTFSRLLDGQRGHRLLRVAGTGTLALGAGGPHNIGYASGSVQAFGSAGLEIAGTGTIGALNWGSGTHGLLSVGEGSATGQLTAAGGVTLTGETTFAVDLNGEAPGTEYDQLVTTGSGGGRAGNVILGGATLEATVGTGSAIGDTYTVISAAGNVEGRFAGLITSGCTLDAGAGILRVDYNPSSVVLTRTATANDLVLGIGGFPSHATAGTPGSFTVTATNCYGNPLTNYNGMVAFTSSDPAATLPPNYTFTPVDAGTHTFTATLRTPGTQSITVTSMTGASGVNASQTGISVTAPPSGGSTGGGSQPPPSEPPSSEPPSSEPPSSEPPSSTPPSEPPSGPPSSTPPSEPPSSEPPSEPPSSEPPSSEPPSSEPPSSEPPSSTPPSSTPPSEPPSGPPSSTPPSEPPSSGPPSEPPVATPPSEPPLSESPSSTPPSEPPSGTPPTGSTPPPGWTPPGESTPFSDSPSQPLAMLESPAATSTPLSYPPVIAVPPRGAIAMHPTRASAGDRHVPGVRHTAPRKQSGALGVTGPLFPPGGGASGHGSSNQSGSHHGEVTSPLEELSSVGLKTASRFAFPLILALLVVAFLIVQGRIDRNDPKLRLAPIDSKHELLRFN